MTGDRRFKLMPGRFVSRLWSGRRFGLLEAGFLLVIIVALAMRLWELGGRTIHYGTGGIRRDPVAPGRHTLGPHHRSRRRGLLEVRPGILQHRPADGPGLDRPRTAVAHFDRILPDQGE